MRVLMVLLALVAMPFVTSVSQERAHHNSGHSTGVLHSDAGPSDVQVQHGDVLGEHADNQPCKGPKHHAWARNAHAGTHGEKAGDCDAPPPPPPPSPTCVVSGTSGGTAVISGQVYNAGPVYAGLPGWCVQLYSGGTVIATAVSDTSGKFTFTGVVDGVSYMVCEVQQAGWTQVAPDTTSGTVVVCPSGHYGWPLLVTLAGAIVYFGNM